ncbi:hypothetical protein B0A48_15281 [Cryoendolithus antarcticus]|uniref:Enoyl reductase (ER) domain-containing protein n=1 Tax=Cryoendolithus antarcticus TaxID=1507870 RepID=A0A1V8SIG6_9PEZI|nr:hypothetical protein B0A48_15281 [Cryoendolithus antarcticus]
MATEAGKYHNAAAWALKPESRPLVVSSAPYTLPPPGHVVIEVHSVAVNPIDHIMQDSDLFHIKYPAIFGGDIAGHIVEVGDKVSDMKVGTRVIANGSVYGANNPAYGAFQKYALVHSTSVAELPYNIPYNIGVVLPLGISTASAGLFQPDFLALPLPVPTPKVDATAPRVVLIWGGSSSVGSCAIQLAKLSGFNVVTTASLANFKYCLDLGADAVYDYHDSNVEDQIVKAIKGRTFAGAYHAVGADGAVETCARIADRSQGKAIVVTVRGVPEKGIPSSVRVKSISAGSIFAPGNGVGPSIWRNFLPGALANGRVKPLPAALVVGGGLRSVQHGLDVQRRGVSARKVVVGGIDGDTSKE